MGVSDPMRLFEILNGLSAVPEKLKASIKKFVDGEPTLSLKAKVAWKDRGVQFRLPATQKRLWLSLPNEANVLHYKLFAPEADTESEKGELSMDDTNELSRLFKWLSDPSTH